MQPDLQIQLLGEFKVVAGGKPLLTVNTPRLQALLAYLLLHRDAPQPRQHVAFQFWPDSSEEQAQTNLRNLLLILRRAFPDVERYISIERRSLQWRDDRLFTLDVLEFEQALREAERALDTDDPTHTSSSQLAAKLRETVDLYTGDLLPACYEEWALANRERLKQGFLWALQNLVSVTSGSGETGTAILYAQRLLRHDPLQEENYRTLMRLHLSMADRASVVNVYRQCERVLRRELGVEPSDMTREHLRRAEELSRHEPRGQRAKTRGKAWVQGNLPAQTATFVGREREVAQLTSQLRQPGRRLITLTGAAGTGKTRLALQVAAGLGTFHDGAFFVSLAALTAPEMVERSIAQALGVAEAANRPLHDTLRDHLHDKDTLLVLDNFEHLLPAANLVAELLAACPRLKALVTSRALLNLRGEHEYAVPPMSLPGRDAPPDPDDLAQYEAVALFVERALEVSPQFALTRENARAVTEICRRLEGLPLAIELAAARIKALSPEAILSRLDRRLKLLVGGKADLPARQQTLETAIAWSYNLLNEEERRLFRGLSVFAGGCSLEAIETVLDRGEPGSSSILEGITSLLNKSLVIRIGPSKAQESNEDADPLDATLGEPRFGMLETLREYSLERLIECGEADALFSRHAGYFTALAENAATKLFAPGQVALFQQVELEHDNIRAALGWSCETGEGLIALRLAGSLDRFWERRGYLLEGRAWLERALTLPAKQYGVERSEYRELARSRANALRALGRFQCRLGEYTAAEATLSESVSFFEKTVDKEGTADALNIMAVAVGMNEFDRGLQIHERCLTIRREIGDRWGIVASLQNIATIKVSQGRFLEARDLCEEALSIQGEGGDNDSKAAILYALGTAISGLGDYVEGQRILGECVELCRELRNNRLMGWALHELAAIAYTRGDYDRSHLLNTESLELFTEQGAKPGIAHAHARLGRDAHRLGNYYEAGQVYLQALSEGLEISLQPALGQAIAGLAGVAAALGRSRESAMLFGSAQGILARIYSSLAREAMTLNMEEARASLGEEAWTAAWDEGYAMPPEQAFKLAQNLL